MFIDREAFILDFRSRAFGGQFCSTAKSLLFGPGMSTPYTTSVQALLCCGF
ncbi:hypothetical protein MN608_11564 [Microdochium nivale]|nr:hypothetical protein MN608_11564 [Microdochium nivale]